MSYLPWTFPAAVTSIAIGVVSVADKCQVLVYHVEVIVFK